MTAAPNRTHRRLAGVAAALALTTVVATGLGPSAGAAPIDDKRKQAAALDTEIAAAADKAAVIYEQLKYVQDQLDVANQTIADAQARIAAAQAETDRLEKLVRERAAAVYRSASRGSDQSFFDLNAREMASREKYSAAASERDNNLLGDLAAAHQDLTSRERDAREAKDAAEAQKAQLDVLKNDFEAAQAERVRLRNSVTSEIADLVAQAAKARAAAQSPKPRRGSPTFDPGELPPVSGSAGIAVNYAKAQLGKPYVYAASGPDAYDCSGLTMASWREAGVALPHNSEAQYYSLPHVPMDQLAPGDIVWYPGHVGLYVGNGAVIHASSSNNEVRYQSVGFYQGGARPG